MTVLADFLEPEALLIAALATPAITGVRGVYAVGDRALDDAFAGKQPPSLHLAYSGYSVRESEPQGAFASLEQEWVVLVQTHSVADIQAGTAARAMAGPIVSAVIARLHGLKLAAGWSRLALVNPPRELYRLGRFLIPIAFRTRVQIESDN